MTDEHLHDSIAAAREKLEQRGDKLGVDLLTCPRCGGDMKIRQTQIDTEPVRNDIRVKCPWETGGCGWWTRHGTSMSAERYDEEMERRDHKLVDAVTTPPQDEEPTENVKERLDALGYADYEAGEDA